MQPDIVELTVRGWCECALGEQVIPTWERDTARIPLGEPEDCPLHGNGEVNGSDLVDWFFGEIVPQFGLHTQGLRNTMLHTVRRYQLASKQDSFGFLRAVMPSNATYVHFNYQEARDAFSIWALVDADEQERVERTFFISATGQFLPWHALDYTLQYMDSVLMPDGFEIYHLFELVEASHE